MMNPLRLVNGRVEDYTIVLSTRDYRHLGQLTGLRTVNNTNNLNSANELTFSVVKYNFLKQEHNDFLSRNAYLRLKNKLWNQIVDYKLIWVKELDEYFEIMVSVEDSSETIKTITATSLCEAELSQIETGTLEINTEADIDRDDYEITTFYNPGNPNASLLHRVLDKAPHYSIKHVDESLRNLQRFFSIDSTIYDFFIGDCSEQFHCLFQFDSTDRSISIYDLYTVCKDCGERGEFDAECPKCGSRNLQYYGEDTTILVDKNNLTDSIQVTTNADSSKNCFKLVAGDELMTATVRMLNPNGSDYIYAFSQEQREDMPKGLVEKLDTYNDLVESYEEEYEELVSDIYDLTDRILYLESGMMPTIEQAEVTASTEAKKLVEQELSPLGLSKVSEATSIATINSALLNYAKVFIKTGYVKLEIASGATFEYVGFDVDQYHYGNWQGQFIITNYSDEEDVITTEKLRIKVYDNYEEFVNQKVLKELAKEDDESSVFDVLAIDDILEFRKALSYYNKNRLQSFYDAIQGALDIIIQMNQGVEEDLHNTLYTPYYNKLMACQTELDDRQKEIDEAQTKLDECNARRTEIQKELDFKNYLGEYYLTFCTYRREQKYSNENYISDGLDNAELLKRAKEFIESAKKELLKSATPQITITSTLYNLLVLPEFKPLIKKFKLGNWIRLKADGVLYRLRLIGYTINFDDLQTIQVEFSTVSRLTDIAYEAAQIIKAAKSMSSTYGYVKHQAKKGDTAQNNINSWMKDSLDGSLIQIKNNENEEVTYGKYGLLCRSYDDITGTYDPRQVKFTHNTIAFTDNNWESVSLAVGEHAYKVYVKNLDEWQTKTSYGLIANFLQAGQVTGSVIIGGEIYSENYSNGLYGEAKGTYINLINGTFSFAGGKLRFDGENLMLDSPDIPSTVQITEINADFLENTDIVAKNLQINAANVLGQITAKQIESVDASCITGEFDGSSINGVKASNITGTLTAEQIGSVNANCIQGEILSSQIEETLTDKTLSGGSLLMGDKNAGTYTQISTDGKFTTSSITVIDIDATEYTGITGTYTIGTYVLNIVNGVVVNVQAKIDTDLEV